MLNCEFERGGEKPAVMTVVSRADCHLIARFNRPSTESVSVVGVIPRVLFVTHRLAVRVPCVACRDQPQLVRATQRSSCL